MGRKPVPQALALPNSMRTDEGPRVAGETDPKAASPNATSPLSPRSPFRPGQTATERAVGPQALQATDGPQQQRQPQPQQQQQRQIPRPENSPADAPSSALTSPAHHPQPSHSRNQAPTQQHHRRGHNRRDEDKASKSSFFFNFGKSSKSTDRLSAYPSSTDPRRETSSRDSTKQPGMQEAGTPPTALSQPTPYPQMPANYFPSSLQTRPIPTHRAKGRRPSRPRDPNCRSPRRPTTIIPAHRSGPSRSLLPSSSALGQSRTAAPTARVPRISRRPTRE